VIEISVTELIFFFGSISTNAGVMVTNLAYQKEIYQMWAYHCKFWNS